jgi:L-erythro-3,5-diaminohexanoate dehydrogenase
LHERLPLQTTAVAGAFARWGVPRALEPAGALPQAAWRLDDDPEPGEWEIAIDVERLNVDSASFRQLREAAAGDAERVAAAIAAIVAERGKLHNPVTDSGGMLVGRVRAVGAALAASGEAPAPGLRIATLASLSLTPLRLDAVRRMDLEHGQVEVEASAILFASSPWAAMPDDIEEPIALAAFDVAGAPSRAGSLLRRGDTVLLVGGGGTAGLLTLHEARRRVGEEGAVVVSDASEAAIADVDATGLADAAVCADATRPLEHYDAVMAAMGGEADVAVNLVNVGGSELGTILLTRPDGTVLFFSTATSFNAAALGAEGAGRPATLIIGNGHMPDRGATALRALRESAELRAVFRRRYVGER